MEPLEREIEYYVKLDGRCPYLEWHRALKDRKTQAIMDVRLVRVRLGNFGHCKPVGGGVLEFKIDYGPGYRIYFALMGQRLVLLLTAGDKSSQRRNILDAQAYWEDHQARFL